MFSNDAGSLRGGDIRESQSLPSPSNDARTPRNALSLGDKSTGGPLSANVQRADSERNDAAQIDGAASNASSGLSRLGTTGNLSEQRSLPNALTTDPTDPNNLIGLGSTQSQQAQYNRNVEDRRGVPGQQTEATAPAPSFVPGRYPTLEGPTNAAAPPPGRYPTLEGPTNTAAHQQAIVAAVKSGDAGIDALPSDTKKEVVRDVALDKLLDLLGGKDDEVADDARDDVVEQDADTAAQQQDDEDGQKAQLVSVLEEKLMGKQKHRFRAKFTRSSEDDSAKSVLIGVALTKLTGQGSEQSDMPRTAGGTPSVVFRGGATHSVDTYTFDLAREGEPADGKTDPDGTTPMLGVDRMEDAMRMKPGEEQPPLWEMRVRSVATQELFMRGSASIEPFLKTVNGTIQVKSGTPETTVAKEIVSQLIYTPRGDRYTEWYRNQAYKNDRVQGGSSAYLAVQVDSTKLNWGDNDEPQDVESFYLTSRKPVSEGRGMKYEPKTPMRGYYESSYDEKQYNDKMKEVRKKWFMPQTMSGKNEDPAAFKFAIGKLSDKSETAARFIQAVKPEIVRLIKADLDDKAAKMLKDQGIELTASGTPQLARKSTAAAAA